ncbi:MAG: rhodanese-like domain-containing protein [Candidatus Thermoplasmatota archaeon]|nr:rhodanese-like domain-containing protein [Candidatus Thermoplasmatota archaeon]
MAKQHSPRFLAIVESARNEIGECSVDDLPALIDSGSVIIDVREQHEFDSGHLIGAIHLGKGVIERDIEKHNFSTEQKLILYCGGGFRSAIAAKSLQDMGYNNVVSLWGGWRSIQTAGLPVSDKIAE